MEGSRTLKVLGCVPSLLNVLFELCEEAEGISSFEVLKNIPVDDLTHFNASDWWNVRFIESENILNQSYNPKDVYTLSVVGPESKKVVYEFFKNHTGIHYKQFINLVHPTSYLSRSATLNYGLQLEPLSTISACSKIGFGVNIKRNCNIGHHCDIGDFVTLNPGVTLSGFVQIGANTMIGSGASIRDGVSIGKNSIIGLGSVVVKDIPDNSIAYGNPCIVHGINTHKEIYHKKDQTFL